MCRFRRIGAFVRVGQTLGGTRRGTRASCLMGGAVGACAMAPATGYTSATARNSMRRRHVRGHGQRLEAVRVDISQAFQVHVVLQVKIIGTALGRVAAEGSHHRLLNIDSLWVGAL